MKTPNPDRRTTYEIACGLVVAVDDQHSPYWLESARELVAGLIEALEADERKGARP